MAWVMGLNYSGSIFPLFIWKHKAIFLTPLLNYTIITLIGWQPRLLPLQVKIRTVSWHFCSSVVFGLKLSVLKAEGGRRAAPTCPRTRGRQTHARKMTARSDPRAHPLAHVHTSTNTEGAQGDMKAYDDVSFFSCFLQTLFKCELLIFECWGETAVCRYRNMMYISSWEIVLKKYSIYNLERSKNQQTPWKVIKTFQLETQITVFIIKTSLICHL